MGRAALSVVSSLSPVCGGASPARCGRRGGAPTGGRCGGVALSWFFSPPPPGGGGGRPRGGGGGGGAPSRRRDPQLQTPSSRAIRYTLRVLATGEKIMRSWPILLAVAATFIG